MSVTVVRGRCGSGKTQYLMERIIKLMKDPFEKILVIVPGQLTFETEKKIMAQSGAAGILGLQVMSIQRLGFKMLEDTVSLSFISNAEKAMICRCALTQSGEVYRGTAQQKGFETSVSELISRLKSYNISPGDLREAAASAADSALAATLCDTAKVYENYIEICGERKDAADMYALAAVKAGKVKFLEGVHVFIDGMDSYRPAVMQMMSAVIAQSAHVTAAFRGDGDDPLFASEQEDMRRLIEAAERAGKTVKEVALNASETRYQTDALKFLEASLYKYPYQVFENMPDGITLYEATSVSHEVDIVCAAILREVQRGKRYRDIAVVVGGVDDYAADIKTRFALAGIPFFIDERRSLCSNTFFDFVHSALRFAAGEAAALPRAVYSRYAVLDEAKRRRLRKYTAKYAYQGWHYRNPFWRGDDAEEAETLRQAALAPLFTLEDGLRRGSAKKQIDAVMRFLMACDVESKLTAFADALTARGMTGEAEYFAQVYDKTTEVLRGIADVYGGAGIEQSMLPALFETGCGATKVAVIPPTSDEVGIFDISLARLKDVDVLFAAGVQDGVWPAGDDAPGILSSSERDAMQRLGVDLGTYDLSAEKLKVYTALSRPSERLYISYNTESGQPSVLIDRIRRIFAKLELEKPVTSVTSPQGMQNAVLSAMARYIRGVGMDETARQICAQLVKQDGWEEQARRMLLRTNAAEAIGKDTAAALYGGIRCAATRIENFYQCPFRHFLDHGIRPEVVRDYLGDIVDIGTFMHLALDLFAKSLLEDRKDIKDITQDETATRMQAAVRMAAQAHEGGKLIEDERFATQLAMLEEELVGTAKRIRRHFIGSSACIHMSEQPFSGFAVPTAFGDAVISGKIDRIDTAEGYFRVVDYKSSKKSFSLNDFASGIALQLPVYIEAARRLIESRGETLLTAGGYYMRIGDAYKQSEQEIDKAARMAGISLNDPDVLGKFSAVSEDGGFVAVDQAVTRSGALHGRGKNKFFTETEMNALLGRMIGLIRKAAEKIYSGDIHICPTEDACAYCAYSAVCMFSEEYDGNVVRTPEPFGKNQLTCDLAAEEEV